MARFSWFTDEEIKKALRAIPLRKDSDPDTPEFHALERERRAIERDFAARSTNPRPNVWIELEATKHES